MSRKTQIHEPSPFTLSEYQFPKSEGFEDQPKKSESRLRKWGKRAIVSLAAAGALFGAERGVSASIDDSRQEVVEVNQRFEPVLKPVAEQMAKDAIDKYEQSQAEKWPDAQGNGYVLESTKDPTKFNLSFNGHLADGSEYTINATVGEDEQGKPDASKVERAELRETTPDNLQTSVTTIGLNDDALDGGAYWGASSALATKGIDSKGYNSFYYGRSYEDLDKKVETAKTIAHSAKEKLGDIEQSVSR
jgi:hypothetical protein